MCKIMEEGPHLPLVIKSMHVRASHTTLSTPPQDPSWVEVLNFQDLHLLQLA